MAFVCVLAIDGAGRLTVPKQWGYFRGWNWANKALGPFDGDTSSGPFFANVQYEGRVYGDLANSTRIPALRVYRPQRFSTDGYGYRNARGRELGPWQVVVVGDSMAAGAGLSDDQTLAAQVEARIGQPVYNAAPQGPLTLFDESRFRARPPRILLWETIERWTRAPDAGAAFSDNPPPAERWPPPWPPAMGAPHYMMTARFTNSAYSPLISGGAYLSGTLRWRLLGPAAVVRHVVGTDRRTLFDQESLTHASQSPEQIGVSKLADEIAFVRDWCAGLGVEVVYLLVPDKASTYRSLVPSRRRETLRPPGEFAVALQSELASRNVPYVDLWGAFQDARDEPGAALYWADDTHWSPRGVAVAAEAVAEMLAAPDITHGPSSKPE